MDVSKLIEELCASVLRNEFCDRSTDYVLKSLRRPSARSSWREEDNLRQVKRLKYDVFDKLLLRKWEWFDCEEREMSGDSSCLSVSHVIGGMPLARRLQVQLDQLKDSIFTERESILCFLTLLSGCGRSQVLLNDSGVCLSESYLSLFEELPRVNDVSNIHTALSSSIMLFESCPGSGYRGWSSQQPLEEDRTPVHTSLFGGLARSTVADLNTKLDLPRLLVHSSPPRDVFSPLPLPVNSSVFSPPYHTQVEGQSSTCFDLSSFESDFLDLSCSAKFEACNLRREWEGWRTRCGYLSELPCFADSSLLAVQRTGHVAKVSEPLLSPQPGDIVRRLISDLDRTHLPDHTSPALSSTSQALASLLQELVIYIRSKLTTISENVSTDITLLTHTHSLLPLSQFVLELVSAVDSQPKALDLIDQLHSLASAGQGNSFYPLLFSLLAYVLEPFFRFVEQWVFLGQLDWGVEFGIHGNQEALERRDETYWRSGYVMVSSCTPTFLALHADTLLTAGKALNLLKICNPNHPLCSGKTRPIKLKVYFNASECEEVSVTCSSYSEAVAGQIERSTKQREEKMQAEKELAMEKVQQRRKEAQKEADRRKEAEEAMVRERRRKKQSLLREMQDQMEMAIVAKRERAAIEKKEDAEMMEKLTNQERLLTQQEEALAAEARAELVAQYAELSKEAELRQARAEWKIRRLNLQEKRIKFFQNEETYWAANSLVAKQQMEQGTNHSVSNADGSSYEPMICAKPADEELATTEPLHPSTKSHDQSCDPFQTGSDVEENRDSQFTDRTATASDEQSSTSTDVLTQQHPQLTTTPDMPSQQHPQLSTTSDMLTQQHWQLNTSPYVPTQQHPQLTTTSDVLTQQHRHSPDVPTQHQLAAPFDTVPLQVSTHSSPSVDALPSRQHVSLEESGLSKNNVATNEQGYPRLISTRGQAPRSTIEQIIYGNAEVEQLVSSRGHAPPSTIHRLLYPLLQKGPETEEVWQTEEVRPAFEIIEMGPSSKFQDDFSKLGAVPMRDMLSCVLGPLRQDPAIVDTSFLSLYPLDALLETCIALPLITQSHLVNEALLEFFLHRCEIRSHFVALKQFLLMEDGEFSHALSTRLCEQLTFGSSSRYLCSSSFLNPLLSFALESSLHGHSPQAQRLAFRIKHQPRFIRTHAVDALEFLELKYEVEWPSNIVITSSMLDKYNKVFQLLLEMKRASWALKTAFHHLRHSQLLKEEHSRQLQIYRHEFQHFVNVMHEYMSNQLFCISWREFEAELATKVHSLDELVKAHKTFIENAIFRCLLSKKAKPVMNVIQEVLASILSFSFQSSLVSSSPLKTFKLMCDTHKRFSDGTGLLIKVVSKLVARGYQPHLEDLLLRLNFNNFYPCTSVHNK